MRDRLQFCDPGELSGGLRLYKLLEQLSRVLDVELVNVFQRKGKKREQLRRAGAFNRKLTGLNRARRQQRLRRCDKKVRKIDIVFGKTFRACLFNRLKRFARLCVVTADHGSESLLQTRPIVKRLPVSRFGSDASESRSGDVVVIENELVSCFGCLFLKFRDRNCGRKDSDLFLGVANENKNSERGNQHNRCSCGNDSSRSAFCRRNIDHVAAG